MKGIDLRKKGKKKSPQRGTQRWKYDHDSNKIISVDSQISNTYNDLVHDIFEFMIDQQVTCNHESLASTLKQHLRN